MTGFNAIVIIYSPKMQVHKNSVNTAAVARHTNNNKITSLLICIHYKIRIPGRPTKQRLR